MNSPFSFSRLSFELALLAGCLLSLFLQPSAATYGGDVRVRQGEGYVLYEPASTRNICRETMPLVVYLHGAPWFIEPEEYDSMLTEIAAAGCVVVLPIYDERDPSHPGFWPAHWYDNALFKTKKALFDIEDGRVSWWSPPLENLALIGHSLGGTYALKMADEANTWYIPSYLRLPVRPKQVVLHDAAGYNFLPWATPQPYDPYWFERLHRIDDNTSLVVIASMESLLGKYFNNDNNAAGIWSRAWHRTGPLANKRGYLATGTHFDVYGTGDFDLYVDVTIDAVKPTFIKGFRVVPHANARFDSWLQSNVP